MSFKIDGEMHYLWRAVDHEGEIPEPFVTKKRDKSAVLKFIERAFKRHGKTEKLVTDGLRSYPAAMREPAILIAGRWVGGSTIAPRIHIFPSDDEGGNAAVSTNEVAPEIRLSAGLISQSL